VELTLGEGLQAWVLPVVYRRGKATIICNGCGKAFQVYKCREHTASRCSVRCPGMWVKKNCELCAEPFTSKKSQNARFGSNRCKWLGVGLGARGVPEEQFWSKVVKGTSRFDCWKWSGAKMRGGYGIFGIHGIKTPQRAHRFSYELHKGPIPKGLFVCHSCDNPECANPRHLWLGTQKQNMEDAKRKGRVKPPYYRKRAALLQQQGCAPKPTSD
jgi:hypothetical protein